MPDDQYYYSDKYVLDRRYGAVTDEWLRVWRVILSGRTMPGGLPGASSRDIEILSSEVPTGVEGTGHNYAAGLRIHFTVNQSTSSTPNTAEITIYNLEESFARGVINENDYVILQAGYEWGQAGTIFSGTVKQYKRGHESVTDSYLKIYAADGDQAFNQATIKEHVKEGTPPKEVVQRLAEEFAKHGVTPELVDQKALVVGANIRSDVLWGLVADELRDRANQNNASWNILHQRFNFVKPQKYDPGAVIDLNAATGLIGYPEMTQDGITVQALINPAIKLRHRIRLDNKYINQYYLPGNAYWGGTSDKERGLTGAAYGSYGTLLHYASTSTDGIYTPLQINYEGDSRGGPWYMNMICLAVDATSGIESAVRGAFDWARW